MDRLMYFLRQNMANIMASICFLLSVGYATWQWLEVPGDMGSFAFGLWIGSILFSLFRVGLGSDYRLRAKQRRAQVCILSLLTVVFGSLVAQHTDAIVVVDGQTTLHSRHLLFIPGHDRVTVIPKRYAVSVVSAGDSLFGGGPLRAALVTTEVSFNPSQAQLYELLRSYPNLERHLSLQCAFAALDAKRQWQVNQWKEVVTMVSAETKPPSDVLPPGMSWSKPLKINWN
jgi:hypothetical protein